MKSLVHPRWPPYLIIALIYLASALIVDPRGEFPLNDDWSYARSAFHLAKERQMRVDEWCAMSLVGQTLYGGLLAKTLGPSFLVLRLSTLALSFGLACILWNLFQQLRVPQGVAWIAVLSWIFNPIQFCLSFTYMTEIPFLFFVGLGLLFYIHYSRSGRPVFLVFSGAALGYAFLIRQTAVLFLASLCWTLLKPRRPEGLRQRLGKAARFAGSASLFIAGYSVWLLESGGATPAAWRKFELLRQLTSEQIVSNLYGLLFYVSFMLLPLLIWQIPRLVRIWRESSNPSRAASLIGWSLLSGFGLWWFKTHYSRPEYLMSKAFHERMPFLLNVLYDTGLGPLTLDPTYYGTSPTPVYPTLWQFVTWVVGGGLILTGLLGTLSLLRIRCLKADLQQSPIIFFGVRTFLLIAAFEAVFSHLQEGGLFDRHILIAVLPLYPVLTLIREDPPHKALFPRSIPWKMGAAAAAALLLALSAYFCVAATHDYFQWNRLRWHLGNQLLARKVDPLIIAGGFEFNGWQNYETFRARGNVEKVYYWWYDSRTYLISMTPQPGYQPIEKLQYFSWVHRCLVPIYLLK